MLDISKNGVELIKKFEGCKLTAYKCPSGVWTIGYGHTMGVEDGMIITQGVAESLLLEDLHNFVQKVNMLLIEHHFVVNQNQFDALVSFAFNCGTGALSTCLSQVNNIYDLPTRMILYNKSNGKVLAGLARRRQAEIDLFNKVGNYAPHDKTTIQCQLAFYGDIIDGYYIMDCGRGLVAKLPVEYVENGFNML